MPSGAALLEGCGAGDSIEVAVRLACREPSPALHALHVSAWQHGCVAFRNPSAALCGSGRFSSSRPEVWVCAVGPWLRQGM